MGYSDPERRRQYDREWVARRRAAYFAGKSCAKCGSTDRLELDHIDPTTKVSHSIWSWSAQRREIELAKCQVLCHDCHKEKTLEQMPITNGYTAHQHGTPSMYDSGCRCDDCRTRAVRQVRERRARRRARIAGMLGLEPRNS